MTNSTMDDFERFDRCKRAHAYAAADKRRRRAMANDIDQFFKEKGMPFSASSKSRRGMSIPESGEYREHMVTYVEKRLLDFLSAQSPPDDEVIAKVRAALNGSNGKDASPSFASTDTISSFVTIDLDCADGPRVVTEQSSTPISRIELTRVALQHLFKIADHHFSLATVLEGEYFGYRCSASQGDVVRMYVKVTREKDEGILRFENWYHRGQNDWEISGFGIVNNLTTYLVGHAVSRTHQRTSLGLRAYALLNYENYGWFHGPLTSMFDKSTPIAARVVLMPADHHETFRTIPTDATGETRRSIINGMIKEEITRESFDKEYRPQAGETPDIPYFVQLQCLIWNGTFTTIHAKGDELNKAWINKYEKLSELQRKAISFAKQTETVLAPFVQIAEKMDEIFLFPTY